MSPPEFAPPSTMAFAGNGYGPGSLSSAESNVIGTIACVDGTTCHGMPYLSVDQLPQSG